MTTNETETPVRRGGHAVVLGAGMAGLVHAVPLAARFDRVTLVDRDTMPDGPDPRQGVPQGRHIHLLVPGGVARLEALLPNVLTDLAREGAHLIDPEDWRFRMGGGRVDPGEADLRLLGATRPLIESVVRSRVLAMTGVEMLDGWNIIEPTTSDDGGRVTGVRLESVANPVEQRVLDADLVVDTTGRGSRATRWLTEGDRPAPEEQRLHVGVHYTTRLFRRSPTDLDGARNVLVDIPPDALRGGVALAVEGDRWLVSLVGMLGERPPTDLDGFVEYAGSLWSADLHTIVAGAEPVGEPSHQTFPAMRWQRYDRLKALPERYLVSGDAVCSFDPRFGQGMTVALIEADHLGRVLDEHGLDGVGHRVLTEARWAVQDAWDLAIGSALANAQVEGARPLPWRVTNAYLGRLLPVAHQDPVVAAAFIRVIGMLDRPAALMHPRIVGRVLVGSRRRRQPVAVDGVPAKEHDASPLT